MPLQLCLNISHYHDTILLLCTHSNNDTEESLFKFFPPEKEPVLKPAYEERAFRAVTSVLDDVTKDEDSDEHENRCVECYKTCEVNVEVNKSSPSPQLTPEMRNASTQGFTMLRKLLFPAVPKFLTDILVFAELGVTITQFVLSLVSVSIENNRGYNITYIVIASVALLLALIDSFVYFVQLGSCARIFNYCYSRCKNDPAKRIGEKKGESDNSCCQFLSPKVKNWLSQSFDLLRNILSELLIYPLVVLDLFDLIVGGTYLRATSSDRINFSLFIIGSTFLVLSVYFTRIFMVISAAINIRRTPLDPSKSRSNMISLVTQFSVHVIFQILVHIAAIAIVGVKIHQENPTPCEDFQSSCTFVSPFLIYVIVVGGILPLYGIGVFFIINYYNLRELSVGFWVNMLALLQSESFASAVFSKKGIKESRKRAEQVVKKIKYEEVKRQLKSFQSVSTWVKVFYPLRFPLLVAIAALYELLILSFVACLAFGTTGSSTGQVEFVLFSDGLSSAAFIVAVLILVANLHVLALVSLWILAAVAFVVLLLLQPVIWIVASLLYIPSSLIYVLLYIGSPKQ